MTFDQKQKTALFRYSVIAPLETGNSDPSISNNEFFRQAAAKSYTDPDGKTVTVGASTIEKWHRAYKKGGFDALFPRSRKDEGASRKLDQDLQSRIRFLLKEHPRITAAEIHRTLLSDGHIHIGQVSPSTVERFVRLEKGREGFSPNKDMRRYERTHINEVWYGDTMYGPWLKDKEGKRRVFLIALIDDASRFIVAADLFFHDSFENLMTVIRSAVSKFGRPGLFTFDNGASYMQYLSSLDMRNFHSLEELRRDFAGYVSRYNQTAHSSLEGISPQERYFKEPERFRRLPPERIETDFLLETQRRVSADNVLVINKVEYEVHYRYAKQKLRLRYSPDMEKVFIVESSGDLTPIRLLNKQENAVVKRERVRLSEGGGEE